MSSLVREINCGFHKGMKASNMIGRVKYFFMCDRMDNRFRMSMWFGLSFHQAHNRIDFLACVVSYTRQPFKKLLNQILRLLCDDKIEIFFLPLPFLSSIFDIFFLCPLSQLCVMINLMLWELTLVDFLVRSADYLNHWLRRCLNSGTWAYLGMIIRSNPFLDTLTQSN